MESTQGYPKLEFKIWWVEMRAQERAITKTTAVFWPKVAQNMGVIIDEPVFGMKLDSARRRSPKTCSEGFPMTPEVGGPSLVRMRAGTRVGLGAPTTAKNGQVFLTPYCVLT